MLHGEQANFKLIETELPPLEDGQLLVKTIALTNDPILRTWIAPGIDPDRFYKNVMSIGSVVDCFTLSIVEESRSPEVHKGDYVVGETGWTERRVVNSKDVQVATALPRGLELTQYLGALGATGLSAYFVLTENLHVTKDDVVLISGAAGGTGSISVQIAKKLLKARKVIGIAGSDQKCRFVESLGADICLNYKSKTFAEDLKNATPGPADFVTAFHDSVGGRTLELGLSRMARHGRIAAVGDMGSYNGENNGLHNWLELPKMQLEVRGFLIYEHVPQFAQAIQVLRQAIEDGTLDLQGSEHVVDTKFEDVPAVWLSLFSGANTGKLISKLVS